MANPDLGPNYDLAVTLAKMRADIQILQQRQHATTAIVTPARAAWKPARVTLRSPRILRSKK